MRLHVLTETKSFRCGLSLVSAAVFALSSFSGSAQAASDTATATAEVIQAITITKGSNLRFGSFIPSDDPGTVIRPYMLGVPRDCTDGVTCFGLESDSGPAYFMVTGKEGLDYDVTLPADNTISINCKPSSSCGTSSMTINVFSSFPDSEGTFPSGSVPLFVGATLKVDANQDPGEYEGNFTVEVTYQ